MRLSMHLFLCPRWTSFPNIPTGSPLLITGPGIKTSGSQDPPALHRQPDRSMVGPPPPKYPPVWASRDADSETPTPTLEAPHHPCFRTPDSHLLRWVSCRYKDKNVSVCGIYLMLCMSNMLSKDSNSSQHWCLPYCLNRRRFYWLVVKVLLNFDFLLPQKVGWIKFIRFYCILSAS